jgi:hypothetical protein
MIHFEQSLFLLALALGGVSASPLPDNASDAHPAVNGTNTGSIYSLDSETTSRPVLWNSGSCGLSTYFPTVDPAANLVAMPDIVMQPYGASQHNTLCGKKVHLKEVGTNKTVEAVVADTNFSNEHSIDMLLKAWLDFGRNPGDADNKGFKIDWSVEM